MRINVIFAVTVFVLTTVSAQSQTKREADAHEHGHGTLNIALEGTTLSMELEVPGADITGFEHVAQSDEDKKKMETALSHLSNPLALFEFSPAGQCTKVSANVENHGEDHETGSSEEESTHSEFHAEYVLKCAGPEKIEEIKFPFFTTFPNSEELQVNIVFENGQSSHEVERDAPTLKVTRP